MPRRRTGILAGAAVGAAALGAESFRPLLMPRPTVFQGGLTAVAALNGAASGAAVAAGADSLTRGALSRMVRGRPLLVGAVAAATAGGTALRVHRFSREATVRHQPGDKPPAVPLVAAGMGWGGAAAVVAGGWASLAATSRSGRRLGRATGLPPWLWTGALRVSGAAVAVVGLRQARSAVVRGALADSRRVEPGFTPPTSAAVSGGPGSLVGFDALGREGRRFVCSATPRDVIEALSPAGAEVRDPIRVFVGYDSAPDPADRVALALDELDRTGAWDRDVLCVQCPAGTGYANSTPVEALELNARGDVATVAIGFGLLPSVMSMDRVAVAARTQWLLLEELARRRAAANRFPRLVLYGESLGALAQQEVFVDRGTVGLDDLGVDAALWVGSPAGAALPRQLLGAPRADVDRRLVARIDRPDQIGPLLAGGRVPRFWFLHHDADPVTRFEPSVAWRRPEWMAPGAPRGRGIPDDLRWRPVLTWWALLVDTLNATNVAPGDFRSSGHDYRADLGAAVRAAYRVGDGVDPEAVESVLRSAERQRGVLAGEVSVKPDLAGAPVDGRRRTGGTSPTAGAGHRVTMESRIDGRLPTARQEVPWSTG